VNERGPAVQHKNRLRLVCGCRPDKKPKKVGWLVDNRDTAPTDAAIEKMNEHFGHLLPEGDRFGAGLMGTEEERRAVHQLSRTGRLTRQGTWQELREPAVFVTTPDGTRKLRLRCSRCGRDEQFKEARVNKLADAVKGLPVSIKYGGLDIRNLNLYLDH
jgi:hypothetical protein